MEAGQVTTLLAQMTPSGFRIWLAGGWGVDAVVGCETRAHSDLDLAVDARDLSALVTLLRDDGYAITTDWLPIRIELTTADGRAIDLHPVNFDSDGFGVQAGPESTSFTYVANGFTVGIVDGRTVPCLSIAQQLRFRDGYDFRPVDHHDVALLRDPATYDQPMSAREATRQAQLPGPTQTTADEGMGQASQE